MTQSTTTLLKGFADLDIRDCESQLPNADVNRKLALQNKINAICGYNAAVDLVTRYHLKEFAYDNLNLLTNLGQPCQSLVEMLQDLISLISPDLR